jgi:hypothetical protein
LNIKYDEPLSNFAFKCNLRRYIEDDSAAPPTPYTVELLFAAPLTNDITSLSSADPTPGGGFDVIAIGQPSGVPDLLAAPPAPAASPAPISDVDIAHKTAAAGAYTRSSTFQLVLSRFWVLL